MRFLFISNGKSMNSWVKMKKVNMKKKRIDLTEILLYLLFKLEIKKTNKN
jgi:hypothetical protein